MVILQVRSGRVSSLFSRWDISSVAVGGTRPSVTVVHRRGTKFKVETVKDLLIKSSSMNGRDSESQNLLVTELYTPSKSFQFRRFDETFDFTRCLRVYVFRRDFAHGKTLFTFTTLRCSTRLLLKELSITEP